MLFARIVAGLLGMLFAAVSLLMLVGREPSGLLGLGVGALFVYAALSGNLRVLYRGRGQIPPHGR